MKEIYLGTVSMEKNRWEPGRIPTFNVSDFIEKAKSDGFYGIELWQYHYTLASDEEKAKLAAADIPFFFNTYLSLEEYDEKTYKEIADAVKAVKAKGVKFNFGRSYDCVPDIPKQLENLKRLTDMMPDYTKMLCECHANTVMEVPETAGEIFAKLDKDRYGAIIHLATDIEFADRCYAAYGDRICHIHCAYKGTDTSGTGFKPMNDGTGYVENMINYYVGKGFNGSLAMEFVKFEDTAEAHYIHAVEDMKYLSTLYK